MALLGAIEVERSRRSPLYYLERHCFTEDEHNPTAPVQPLIHGAPAIDPFTLQLTRELNDSEDDYLRYLTIAWSAVALLAIPKSRQMRVSHWAVHVHGWLARFRTGMRIAVQSKKMEDADALLERLHRAQLAQAKLSPHIRWPGWTRKEGRIIYDCGSVLMAIPQGEDKVRSYTFTAILSDEMGFQDKADESFTAAAPTIEGGGKYTAISSANPGFFQQLVQDKGK